MRKTLKVTEDLHQRIKVFCVENKLKMNEWIENEIKKILDKNDNRQRG
jgi:predicted HicB family RNase H-like nuclease